MIPLTATTPIVLATAPVDFRAGIDGMVALCQHPLQQNPRSGTHYVFINRRTTMIRILVYEKNGYWLMTQRLSQGRYRGWPQSGEPISVLQAVPLRPTAGRCSGMTPPFEELNQAELDGLIARVKEAAEYGLALSAEDLQRLLNALLMLAQRQAEMAEQDITLHKRRKLAGIVKSSEKLKDIIPGKTPKTPAPRQKPKPTPKPLAEPVIHERCQPCLTGLEKGQRCPECGRGTLYKYTPAVVLRISGQTPLKSTQHLLERLRCNTGGAYFTADLPEAVLEDGPAEQTYGYSAQALMAIQKYFAGADRLSGRCQCI